MMHADSTASKNEMHNTVSFLRNNLNNFITDSILPLESGLPAIPDRQNKQTYYIPVPCVTQYKYRPLIRKQYRMIKAEYALPQDTADTILPGSG